MVEAAGVIAKQTDAFWTDQLKNEDQLVAYHAMAEEIWRQTGGQVDGFVQSVGTGASVRGNAQALRRYNARVKIVAVEPAESRCCRAVAKGAHKIDGIGAGFVVPLWRNDIADRIERLDR
jgi:cysteine synthase A